MKSSHLALVCVLKLGRTKRIDRGNVQRDLLGKYIEFRIEKTSNTRYT
jgi:hypothetical protein